MKLPCRRPRWSRAPPPPNRPCSSSLPHGCASLWALRQRASPVPPPASRASRRSPAACVCPVFRVIEGAKVTGEHRSHREGVQLRHPLQQGKPTRKRLPTVREKLAGVPLVAGLELDWCCLMDVNEVLAQQLAQPLINGHRHLLALELAAPAYVGVILVKILCYIWKRCWLGRLFFYKTVVLCYFTLPLQHTPSEWSSKTVNDPEIPTPLHYTPRPAQSLRFWLIDRPATHTQLGDLIGGGVGGRSTRTRCSRLLVRRVCPISASCVVAIFGCLWLLFDERPHSWFTKTTICTFHVTTGIS